MFKLKQKSAYTAGLSNGFIYTIGRYSCVLLFNLTVDNRICLKFDYIKNIQLGISACFAFPKIQNSLYLKLILVLIQTSA